MNPIKIPVFYYKANGHIPHTFIFDVCKDQITKDDHIWGLPELEYPGLVKVKSIKNFGEKCSICPLASILKSNEIPLIFFFLFDQGSNVIISDGIYL